MAKSDVQFKARIVHLILLKRPEEALRQLSIYYNVEVPKIRIGVPKGHAKSAACYVAEKKTIFFSNQESLFNPFIVIHEFYHHLRFRDRRHRGTEKHADAFTMEFMKAYKKLGSKDQDR